MIKLTLGEALRLAAQKADHISELLTERDQVAWTYVDSSDTKPIHVRPYKEVDLELQHEVEDRITLKSAIMNANISTLITLDSGKKINLNQANLLIDRDRKEIKSLKGIAKDPGAPSIHDTYRYGFRGRTKDDLPLIPMFDAIKIRETIKKLEAELRSVDAKRNVANWKTEIEINLYER